MTAKNGSGSSVTDVFPSRFDQKRAERLEAFDPQRSLDFHSVKSAHEEHNGQRDRRRQCLLQ